MDCDSLIACDAIRDLVLSEALEVHDETEVFRYLLAHLMQPLRQSGVVLGELDGADEDPSAF